MRKISIFVIALFLPFLALAEGTSNYDLSGDVISPEYGASAPAKGESRVHSVTGATIGRVTTTADCSGQPYCGTDRLIVYSRYSPTNSDGTYLLVHAVNSTSAWVYRVSDNTLVANMKYDATHDAGEVNEIRWDYTGSHPLRVYMVSEMKFIQIDNVLNQDATRTTVRDFSADFPSAYKIANDVEGDSSSDSRYWAWEIRNPYNGSTYPMGGIFTYDKTDNVILGTMLPTDSRFSCYGDNTRLPPPNMVEISPNGDKAIVHWGRAYTGSAWMPVECSGTSIDSPHAYTLALNDNGYKVSVDQTHAGWGFDNTGKQLFVSQNNQTDWIEACYIDNGTCFNIIQQTNLSPDYNVGYHFGKTYNANKRGWVLLSTYANATTYWGQEQLIMLELKPSTQSPRYWRISPTYAAYAGDYRQESQAALSMNGNTVWWNNRWGAGAQTIGHQEVFKVELPSDWHSTLGGWAGDGPDTTPPIRSIGSPTGTLSAGTTSATMSLVTNENATCKYGTSDVAYASLPSTFSTTGGTSHSQNLTGLTNGSSYTYYIRCQDSALNANTTGYPISFSIANPGGGVVSTISGGVSGNGFTLQ